MTNRFCRFFIFGFLLFGLGPAVSSAQDQTGDEEDEEKHGFWLERDDGRQLFFSIEENNFSVAFFNEEKEPADIDVRRGIVHYTPRMVQNRETVILHPDATGESLTSERYVRPPHHFQVVLVLVRDEEGREAETFAFRYVPEGVE